jgi:3D (Asp-Asp-Asp) domain-containing protein
MLARSRAWQLVVLLVAISALLLTHGWRTHLGDRSDESLGTVLTPGTSVRAGARITLEATAYCKGTVTASGALVRSGVVAADPDVLPEGSVLHISGNATDHSGVYTVLDTGPNVQGSRVDIYMWSCIEALTFGRRSVGATVLRVGWDPRASAVPRETLPQETR